MDCEDALGLFEMTDVLEVQQRPKREALVHILMATHQGERFIEAQLDSIQAQTHANWILHLSDDASSDATLEKLDRFVKRWNLKDRVHQYSGPNLGSTPNFLHLIGLMKPWVKDNGCQDLFAFCDQDDVWLPDKLERAVCALQNFNETQKLEPSMPFLYVSTSIACDSSLRPLSVSKVSKGKIDFAGALIQNRFSGNTMVMNSSLVKILQKVDPMHSVWHDWTTFMVATGCGGHVYVDVKPSVLYRQHDSNVIGEPRKDLKTQSLRLLEIRRGRYKAWLEKNTLAAQDIWEELTPSAKKAFERLQEIRIEPNARRRWRLALRSGLKRQGVLSQMAFWALCALGWV